MPFSINLTKQGGSVVLPVKSEMNDGSVQFRHITFFLLGLL